MIHDPFHELAESVLALTPLPGNFENTTSYLSSLLFPINWAFVQHNTVVIHLLLITTHKYWGRNNEFRFIFIGLQLYPLKKGHQNPETPLNLNYSLTQYQRIIFIKR